ncbi:MAG: hypothetical protein RSD48_06375, partial [Oscillospiraceae bacterium]
AQPLVGSIPTQSLHLSRPFPKSLVCSQVVSSEFQLRQQQNFLNVAFLTIKRKLVLHGAKRHFVLDLSFSLFGISKNRFSFRKKRNGVLGLASAHTGGPPQHLAVNRAGQ